MTNTSKRKVFASLKKNALELYLPNGISYHWVFLASYCWTCCWVILVQGSHKYHHAQPQVPLFKNHVVEAKKRAQPRCVSPGHVVLPPKRK